MYYIYVIQNRLDLKVYIGQSVNPKRRWTDHKWLSKNKPEQYIHRAMAKYGSDNFVFQIIDQTDDGYKISDLEIDWINWFKSRDKQFGYNLSPGGDVPWNRGLPPEQQSMYGKHHSEESKRKISDSNIGKIKPPHTDEWKKNNSIRMKNHIVSDYTRKKISDAQIGKYVSNETRQKISIANKAKIVSEETRKKMSDSHKGENGPHYGKIMAEETKQKISKSKKGSTLSEETKRKMSDSRRGKISYRKFSLDIEIEITKMYISGISTKRLSEQYKCSIVTIRNIVKRNINEI